MVRLAAWALAGLGMAFAGFRFFPRYYFAVLPPVVLAAARGYPLLGRWRALLPAVLLLVPLVRFGPRYVVLAEDLAAGKAHYDWRDLALYNDIRDAAGFIRREAKPGDTLFVWGYRPQIYALSGLPAATRFLDSQPLNGVAADRHLTDSTVIAPQMAHDNRLELIKTSPTWVVDGLGPLNPKLRLADSPDLKPWLDHYEVAGTTRATVIYHRRPANGPSSRATAFPETRRCPRRHPRPGS